MKNLILKCAGCSQEYDLFKNSPIFGCKNLGRDSRNHILIKNNNLRKSNTINFDLNKNSNPYIEFKEFYYTYKLAKQFNVSFEEIVEDINSSLIAIDEPGFSFTELKEFKLKKREKTYSLYIKNETGNVAGSHKARHLMGNILYLEVLRKAQILKEKPDLAIYSCGNAAMGAAAIAKAAGYKLKVFIPVNVSEKVINVLNSYNAKIVVCKRREGETGDPCYLRFQEALSEGAFPFSCSGPDNWSNIEGGQSLLQELLIQAKNNGKDIDSLIIQIGGGALASSAIQTIEDFKNNKIIDKVPKIFTVQTEGGYPLVRAYYLLLKEIADKNNLICSLDITQKTLNCKILSYIQNNKKEIEIISDFIRQNYLTEKIQTVLQEAAQNRKKYMWVWETEPHSIAHGILDDITYDWFKIIQGMFISGGIAVTVNEEELKRANEIGRNLTGINADYTGTSGFTGLIKLIDLGWIIEENKTVVLFTGIQRQQRIINANKLKKHQHLCLIMNLILLERLEKILKPDFYVNYYNFYFYFRSFSGASELFPEPTSSLPSWTGEIIIQNHQNHFRESEV